MKAIAVRNLNRNFGALQALKDFTLDVEKGSVMGLIGPNGAGKTTFIRLLAGLIAPDSGTINIMEEDILNREPEYRQNIGFVPEECQLYDYMTLEDLFSFVRGFYREWNSELVARYTESFGLPSGTRIGNYSRGMKAKASLILALAHNPDILVLDEPTSGLDPIFRREFLNVIMEEMILEGKTVLFSSHIIDDVERIADQVAIINRGRLVKVRPMDELKSNEKKIRVVFQKMPEEDFFSYPGIENVENQGSAYIITVADNFEEIYKMCKDRPHYALEIIERSLEDILINTAEENRK